MYQTTDPQTFYWREDLIIWLPRILGAVAILVVAWILARVAKWAIAKVVDRVPALRHHNETEPGKTVGGLIGEIAFWLILLIGIMLALQPLGLTELLEPVRQLTTDTFAFIPNLFAAALIFVIGLAIGKIVRRSSKAHCSLPMPTPGSSAPAWSRPASPAAPARPRPSFSRTVGAVVFYLIMIPVAIAALEALKIEAISGPATEMLRTILDAIPNVLGAAILIAIGYFLGKLAKGLIEQALPSLGFDRAIAGLGFSSGRTTPSRAIGTATLIAILIFFAIKAAELLNSPIIAAMLAQVLELGSRILFGTGLILAGVLIARIVANLVSSSGSAAWLPAILRWSIIALAVAMGLRFMGLANEIVIIAFASIIGSGRGRLRAGVRARRPAGRAQIAGALDRGQQAPHPAAPAARTDPARRQPAAAGLTLPPSLRAQRSNPVMRQRLAGLPRRYAPRNDG